jgi:hypothetical protein
MKGPLKCLSLAAAVLVLSVLALTTPATASITPLWDYTRTILDRFDGAVAYLHDVDLPAPNELPKFVVHKVFWADDYHAWNALLPQQQRQVDITGDNVIAAAQQFGAAVSATTGRAQDRAVATQLLRDCTRNALSTTAFDLWWASLPGNSFNVNTELKQTITDCLATYTEAAPQLSQRVAVLVTAQIATGVVAVETVQGDYATVSDWTRALQGYLPA